MKGQIVKVIPDNQYIPDNFKLVGYSSDGLEAKWHKYDFFGEIRCYQNKLTLIDDGVKYLGLIHKPTKSHWDVEEDKQIPIQGFKKLKIIEKEDMFIKPFSDLPQVYTRRNKWFKLTEKALLIHPLKGKCCYCKVYLYNGLNYSRDHIIPSSKGGKGGSNLKSCCSHCNSEKGNMMLSEYIQLLNRKWVLSITNSVEYKYLQIKIMNANRLAKEIDPR